MDFQLKSCVWEITLGCCFSCKYCGSKAGKPRENELSLSECLNVADQLVDLGCKRVSMIGGEVFMRKDWKKIVARLTSQNVRVAIITNGFLFNEKLIQQLKEVHIESVAVSLDGIEEIHDRYRQTGSYQRAVQAIEVLCKNHIPVSIITTLNKENSNYLEEFYSIICQYPIFAWQLQACSPMGNAAIQGIDYHFDSKKVMDFVDQYRKNAKFKMGVADNIGYYLEYEGYLRGDETGNSPFRGCSAGLSSIGIDSIGNIRGCESMYDEFFIEGNVRERNLKDIWNDPNCFTYNRKFSKILLEGKCAKCDKGNKCAAGCRSYNYFVHGKLYESAGCVKKTI